MFNCLRHYGKVLENIGKYSIATDSLEIVGKIVDDHINYCVCGFIDKIYFVGGYLKKNIRHLADILIQMTTRGEMYEG